MKRSSVDLDAAKRGVLELQSTLSTLLSSLSDRNNELSERMRAAHTNWFAEPDRPEGDRAEYGTIMRRLLEVQAEYGDLVAQGQRRGYAILARIKETPKRDVDGLTRLYLELQESLKEQLSTEVSRREEVTAERDRAVTALEQFVQDR